MCFRDDFRPGRRSFDGSCLFPPLHNLCIYDNGSSERLKPEVGILKQDFCDLSHLKYSIPSQLWSQFNQVVLEIIVEVRFVCLFFTPTCFS